MKNDHATTAREYCQLHQIFHLEGNVLYELRGGPIYDRNSFDGDILAEIADLIRSHLPSDLAVVGINEYASELATAIDG